MNLLSPQNPVFATYAIAYFTGQIHDVRATFWTVGSLVLIFMTCRTLVVARGY